MADNTVLDPGAGGDTVATDDIGGTKHQRVKVQHGADGSATDVSAASPLPVDSELPAAAGLSDSTANPTSPMVGAGGMFWNGSVWVRAQGAADGLPAGGIVAAGDMVWDPAAALFYRLKGAYADGMDKLGLAASGPALYNGSTYDRARGDTANGMDVDVTRSALPTGAATSAKQDTIIGHVDGVEAKDFATQTTLASVLAAVDGLEGLLDTVEALLAAATPAGSNNIGQVDPRGNAAHDGADSGNPVKTGGRARTALPTAVAQDDRADTITDKHGRALIANAPIDQRTSGKATYTNTTAADLIAAPGASVAVVVTSVLVVNAHASVGTKVEVRDGTTVKFQGYAGILGGGFQLHDPDGLFVATANTAVTGRNVTTGADVDIFVSGFKIPA